MATAYFYTLTKRKNSTLQPTGGTSLDINLKSGTSLISPTFLLNLSGRPTYNYVSYEGRYYFVADIVSVRNDLWEIVCDEDHLATYKSDILASTQFVAYSSVSGNAWLADTRIPVQKNATVSSSSTAISILDADGFYVLSVVGKNSAATYRVSLTQITDMLAEISNWKTTGIQSAEAELVTSTDVATVLNGVGKALIQTGFVGNAYADAPNCIRSCIWVPFAYALYDGSDTIHLGDFDTHVLARKLSTKPTTNTASISIPWQYSDWRRTTCEDVYLYLPLVGMVSIPSDEIVNTSSLTIMWSATATDGCISYEVKAGSQIIGTYGGNCSANYPIGISQQASAGEIFQSYLNGAQQVTSAAMQGTITPFQTVGTTANLITTSAQAAYNSVNTHYTKHNSCIGGIGGGAGSGLDLTAICFTVAHPTIINPSDMMATMGVPTQKPIALSTCSGYCECVNAHVAINGTDTEMDMIDNYLNSGFYIE